MGGRGTWESTDHFRTWTEDNQKWVCEEKIDGVKVIHPKGKKNGNLPEFAKTSEAYISRDQKGEYKILRVYEDHYPILEFDLGHPHHHGLEPGEIHVHHYSRTAAGMPSRDPVGVRPTNEELGKWKPILEKMIERNKGK